MLTLEQVTNIITRSAKRAALLNHGTLIKVIVVGSIAATDLFTYSYLINASTCTYRRVHRKLPLVFSPLMIEDPSTSASGYHGVPNETKRFFNTYSVNPSNHNGIVSDSATPTKQGALLSQKSLNSYTTNPELLSGLKRKISNANLRVKHLKKASP